MTNRDAPDGNDAIARQPDDWRSYDDLLQAIYEAGTDARGWTAVTSRIAAACGASRAMLFTLAHTVDQGGFCFPHNIPQLALDRWSVTDEAARDDPFVRVIRQRRLMAEGVALNGDDLVTRGELTGTRFYREWWAPFGIARLCTGIVFDGTDAHKLPAALSLYRSADEPRFGQREVALLGRLLPHLSRALGTMFHLTDAAGHVAATREALDRLPGGVVIVDADTNVVFANRSARAQAERGSAFALSRAAGPGAERLTLGEDHRSREAELRDALARALQPVPRDDAEHFTKALLLSDPSGGPRCLIHVVPLLGRSPAFGAARPGARAILFLYDVGRVSAIEAPMLCAQFGLTPAEARTTRELVRGGSADEIAARLGLSVGTIKTQLRQSYLKTGTRRRTDLLKLLLSLVAH